MDDVEGITHVFFDVGGTLLLPEPGAPELFRRVLAGRGHAIDRETVFRLLRAPESLVNLIRPLAEDRQAEYYRHVNARVLEHLGFSSDDAILDELRAGFDEIVWRPYPDAVEALEALRAAGFHLGVVSNADHRLPRVLRDCGLAGLLETVTVSTEVGAEKPDPRIFRRAVAQAGTSPERSLHVGDNFEADYIGARNAGLHAVVVLRGHAPPAPCPHVTDLKEIPPRLAPPRSRP